MPARKPVLKSEGRSQTLAAKEQVVLVQGQFVHRCGVAVVSFWPEAERRDQDESKERRSALRTAL